jgi:glutamyl/glutaminyl-tRNA synthetase
MTKKEYRDRIAPSPTGLLHLGHAMTFWQAQERAREAAGTLVLRIEDLDRDRCRKEFADAISEDLRWFGLDWDEGPDIGGPFVPDVQSERRRYYLEAWEKLCVDGFIYPCKCSCKDVMHASLAPREENEEPIYPGTCRPSYAAVADAVSGAKLEKLPPGTAAPTSQKGQPHHSGQRQNAHWRFRVPDDERIDFVDERVGKQSAVAGRDFGDFLVWRREDVPAYQLAVVVDDATMQISEVVRGEDLLMSTFRQLLLYRALDLRPPKFYHAPLVLDESGKRLAKRHGALSLRKLRERGTSPQEIRAPYE